MKRKFENGDKVMFKAPKWAKGLRGTIVGYEPEIFLPDSRRCPYAVKLDEKSALSVGGEQLPASPTELIKVED